MDDFLRVLIISINTMDGIKNSTELVQKHLFSQKVNKIKKNLEFLDMRKINRKATLTP